MPRGELLKKLFHSYAQGDNEAFHEVATEIIRDVWRKAGQTE
jgi:hypothetical protein